MKNLASGFVAAAALATALALPGQVLAQAENPLTAGAQTQFNVVRNFVVRAAEKIPEELYGFRPTPEVRSIGELFGHIADEYFGMCASAGGEAPPRVDIESSARTKAELVQALNEGAAYCASVFAAMNDTRGIETVPFYFGPTPRLSVLYFAVAHAYEHYGNLVTYMRLNDIVPPSSETPAP